MTIHCPLVHLALHGVYGTIDLYCLLTSISFDKRMTLLNVFNIDNLSLLALTSGFMAFVNVVVLSQSRSSFNLN